MRKAFGWLLAGVAAAGMAAAGASAAPKKAATGRPVVRPSAVPNVGPITGPVAEYWVSADTSSGFGAGMTAGQRPSMGAIMGMMSGRQSAPAHTLTLQLGSTQRPAGALTADAYVSPPLGVGASLPLVSPQPGKAAEAPEKGSPESFQRPKGRLLIYWGCGDHVGPGQPVVLDFSTLGTGAPLPDMGAAFKVYAEQAPSPARFASYGSWPNSRKQITLNPQSSLVGAHSVRGTYAPDIAFQIGAETDFMGPMGLTDGGRSVGGGERLTWNAQPQATGHHLLFIGANQGGESGGGRGRGRSAESVDMVFWSSSAVKPGVFGGGLGDYLPPAEVRRLVGERAVLPPQTAECVMPAEVVAAAPMGLVNGISYGPEQIWTDPPRPRSGPWDIRWRAKVRVKATANTFLGMPGMGGRGGDDDDRGYRGRPGAQPQQPVDPRREFLRRLRPF